MTPYTADDYAGALRALMPRGRAWSDDPSSVQATTYRALADTPARLDADAVTLVADAFPATADALLPEWEATLGLPDTCLPANADVAPRRAMVVRRLSDGGGQSLAVFEGIARDLGFGIVITQYAACRAGIATANSAVFDDDWASAWGVTVVTSTGAADVSALMCVLERQKPAHTTLFLLD